MTILTYSYMFVFPKCFFSLRAVRQHESRSETSGGQAAQPVSYSMFQRLNLAPEVFTVGARQSVIRAAVRGADHSVPLQALLLQSKNCYQFCR